MNLKDDSTLVRRSVAGNEAALAELYNRYADMLYAFISHLVYDPRIDTADIWHDAWLAAIRSLHTFDHKRCRFFTWLCSIARHKAMDSCRRAARRPAESLSSFSPDRLAALIDDGPLPEEAMASSAVRTSVIEALAALPAEYRRILVARYADGATVQEAAQLAGKSYKAAESLLSRARAAFRLALKKATGETHDG